MGLILWLCIKTPKRQTVPTESAYGMVSNRGHEPTAERAASPPRTSPNAERRSPKTAVGEATASSLAPARRGADGG